jgi:hypothetical protein
MSVHYNGFHHIYVPFVGRTEAGLKPTRFCAPDLLSALAQAALSN